MLPDRASSAMLTTPRGTSAPTVAAPSTAKQFVLGTLLAGSVFTATLTAVTPAEALALTAPATTGRTLPAAPTPATPVGPRSVADVLSRLRHVSGLSWGEIASAVGVSRRAIHHWLSGGRVAGAHMGRLLAFQRTVAAHELGSAEETRLRLQQPGVGGRNALENFRLQTQATRPTRRPVAGSVSDLLSPDEEVVESAVAPPTRRSALRSGTIPPRGPRTA